MSEPISWSLLARYLSGECSDKEKETIETWFNSDPENQRLLELMKIAWNTPEAGFQTSDVKRLWKELAKQAGIISDLQNKLKN